LQRKKEREGNGQRQEDKEQANRGTPEKITYAERKTVFTTNSVRRYGRRQSEEKSP